MRFRLSVTLLEAPAAHAEQVVSINARHLRVAINRGLKEILNNPHLKRRRIRSGKISFVRLDTNDNARGNINNTSRSDTDDSACGNTNGNGNGGSQ